MVRNQRHHISYLAAFLAGGAGAILMSVLLWLFQVSGLTPFNLSELFGSMFFVPDTIESTWVGFLIYLFIGGTIGILYERTFRQLNRSGFKIGLGMGVLHGVIAGLFLGIAPVFHPSIPEVTPSPGFFASNYGYGSVFSVFVAHLLYGITVGVACWAVAHNVGDWHPDTSRSPA